MQRDGGCDAVVGSFTASAIATVSYGPAHPYIGLMRMTALNALCFVVTKWKKPFSVKGFDGWFREQCDAARLPQCSAHGLRKAIMRRMAEPGHSRRLNLGPVTFAMKRPESMPSRQSAAHGR